MTLKNDYKYVDPVGGEWVAPAGSVVDGASIPRFAWSVIGGPFEGKYRNASVIHDVACAQKSRPYELVHLTFYYAMLAGGVDTITAKAMYGAVFHFGPKWGEGIVGANGTDNTSHAGAAIGAIAGSVLGNKAKGALSGALSGGMTSNVAMQERWLANLKKQIEQSEATGEPMTLDQIRALHSPH